MRSVEVGRRVGVCYYFRNLAPAHTPDGVEERKSFVRMYGVRKACYKCGNGASAPFNIIRVG